MTSLPNPVSLSPCCANIAGIAGSAREGLAMPKFSFLPRGDKFFNLFVIGANLFTAFFLVYLWKQKLYAKLLVPIFLFFLTLSGIIDIFPIFNDRYMEVKDIPNNKATNYILNRTPKDAVFLNASFLYDPASLAGRRIYLGWPYFSWSAGYDSTKRFGKMQSFLAPDDKASLCSSLAAENIGFIEIQAPSYLEDEDLVINYSFFENNFVKIYHDSDEEISIYDVVLSCKK